jgi:hypothetical protein
MEPHSALTVDLVEEAFEKLNPVCVDASVDRSRMGRAATEG